jgi:hypothetical protein
LNRHIKPIQPLTPEDEKRLIQFVKQLGSDRFTDREKADQVIRDQGTEAEGFLRTMLKQKWDAETRQRLEKITDYLTQLKPRENFRSLRVLEILERMNSPESRSLLEKLSGQEAKASLERLKRRP